MPPVITLTTDLGLKDYYVASVKAAILSQCSDAVIIDISHNIPQFDILQTAFVISNSYRDFPEGTIHIIGVMPDKNNEFRHIAALCDNQYFIGADNGIFSLIFNRKPEKIFELNIKSESETFPIKDVFVKAACHLARGGKPEIIGKPIKEFFQRAAFNAVVTENSIRGTVVYVDDFGNAFINITEHLFRQNLKGRQFLISFRRGGHKIQNISRNYSDAPAGERLALFSANGFLEIAINMGNASELLGLHLNDIVMMDFLP